MLKAVSRLPWYRMIQTRIECVDDVLQSKQHGERVPVLFFCRPSARQCCYAHLTMKYWGNGETQTSILDRFYGKAYAIGVASLCGQSIDLQSCLPLVIRIQEN